MTEYLCRKYLAYHSKWRAELRAWIVVLSCRYRRNCILFFQFTFDFGIVYIWPMYRSFDERIWFMITFSLAKRVTVCSKYHFFVNFSLILSQLLLPTMTFKKCIPSVLMGNCDHHLSWCINSIFYALTHKVWKVVFELEDFSYNFKIDCILVRHLMSFKKIALSSSKFNIF